MKIKGLHVCLLIGISANFRDTSHLKCLKSRKVHSKYVKEKKHANKYCELKGIHILCNFIMCLLRYFKYNL